MSPCRLGCVVPAAVRAGSRLCLGRLSGEAVVLCRSCTLSPAAALFCLRACSVSASIIVLITPQLVNYELEEGISVSSYSNNPRIGVTCPCIHQRQDIVLWIKCERFRSTFYKRILGVA